MIHEDEIERVVSASLFRHNCPSNIMLGDHQAGLLAGDENARVTQHIALCPHCQAYLTTLNTFLAEIADEDAVLISAEQDAHAWRDGLGWRWTRIKQTGRVIIQLLNAPSTPIAAPIATRGHSSADTQDGQTIRRIALTVDETGVANVNALVQQNADDLDQCTITIQVQSPEQWPDYSGVRVQAQAGDWSAEGITDSEGFVVLNQMSIDQVDNLSLQINSIEDT